MEKNPEKIVLLFSKKNTDLIFICYLRVTNPCLEKTYSCQ